jgi:glycosyltransferase involved in cell wall biosynthesis
VNGSPDVSRPLLSIVVPSCNRQKTLLSVLATLVAETAAELVVSDNSDAPLTDEALRALGAGERLRYRHWTERMSVVDNFERGLAMATGEYLLFIGDDDCVGPGIDAIVAWMKRDGIDALVSYRSRFIASYFWPGVKSRYFGDAYQGKLFLSPSTGRAIPIERRAALAGAANRPGTGLNDMARAYHGIVSRALVDRVVARFGQLFGGVSPDIYSATLLTELADKPYILDYPFVVPGASAASTAGEGAASRNNDRLDAREHIKRFGANLKWDERIPSFYSPDTVWAFSHQSALDRLGVPGLGLNFPRLYLRCALMHRHHRAETLAALRVWRRTNGVTTLVLGVIGGFFAEALAQVRRVWFRFVTPPRAYADQATIGDAYATMRAQLKPWSAPDAS